MDKEQLLELLENKKYSEVKKELDGWFIQDIADFLEEIKKPIILLKVFKLLPKEKCAEVFSYLNSEVQEELVQALSDNEISYIVEDMYIDDAVDLIEEMPANVVNKILKNSTPQTRKAINKLLCYEDDSAGSIMTTEFLSLKQNVTIKETLSKIRVLAQDLETINVIYVTSEDRILKGVLSIRDVLTANDDQKLSEIMNTNIVFAKTTDDQEQIANTFKKYGLLALPIVDNESRLVGIVTVDDVMEIIEEENTEDISKMAAITPTDKPYLKTSVWSLCLTRVLWLVLLMLSSSLTSIIITKNEQLLSSSAFGIVLTACIPMIMGTSGNAGGQASATIIRGIAIGDISFKDTLKVIWKEIRVAILLGVVLCALCYLKLLYIDGIYATESGYLVAGVICLAMFFTILIAKIVGCALPLIAKKCHLDPAVMASPFITTIIDAVSLLVLCAFSMSMLPM